MTTNNHELAQSIAEAVMKQFSNFKSEFNAEAVASAVYNVLNTETCFDMPAEPGWDKSPEEIVNEAFGEECNTSWDTDTLLCELSGFIQKNTNQETFKKHIDALAIEYTTSDSN
jgi:hypothetical protein